MNQISLIYSFKNFVFGKNEFNYFNKYLIERFDTHRISRKLYNSFIKYLLKL